MGDIKGFMSFDRQEFKKTPVEERIQHFKEFTTLMPDEDIKTQGARCMDCGIPFCSSGCPINNIIPDWNDLVYRGRWKEAMERLAKTNNFPEFTGRVCPAPCENSCVLGINAPAVTIKNIEVSIVERAYEEGWLKPVSIKHRSGKVVAIVGSGPAGLACADQLNRLGHTVTVYEKNEVLGGLLTLGIPEFKMEKWVVERRLKRMAQEGVKFKTGINIGLDIPVQKLISDYDAVVLCGGAEHPRDLPIPGRDLEGVYFAMQFLTQQNRLCLGQKISDHDRISAEGKNVVVIGGGDTGSDCVGTSIRQGAKSVRNFELLERPPKERSNDNPWPKWALIERTSSSHEEGCERIYSVLTKSFEGVDGRLTKLKAIELQWGSPDPLTGRRNMTEIKGSEFEIETDLVLLAMGFLGPVKNGMLEQLGVELTERGNVKSDANKMTSIPGVFTAGDMTRGQSLVVWAIQEGRAAAEGVHQFLKLEVRK